jgi:hypothetical protein
MRAGLVPLVTRTAGTRSEARAINPSLVVDPNAEALARGISAHFNRDIDDRRALATRARERGSRFDYDSRTAAFRDSFRKILNTL